jgi:tryptophan-rich sensory protein
METVAIITMILATGGLLALMVAATRGYRLPTPYFQPRTWLRAIVWTGTLGGAATIGAILADGTTIAAFAIGATALLLVLEFALWSDAFTFGSRDR